MGRDDVWIPPGSKAKDGATTVSMRAAFEALLHDREPVSAARTRDTDETARRLNRQR